MGVVLMRLLNKPLGPVLLLTAGLALAPAVMAEMYRFKDDQGQTVLSNTLPREARSKGYEILNNSGRVIEKVPPPPTEEEIAERKRQKELERKRREQKKRQEKVDKRLLRQYSSPDDATRALHRKLRERFSAIKLKLGNINSLNSQIADERNRAANMERSGKEVPDSLRKKMKRLRADKSEVMTEIQQELNEVKTTREAFRDQINRLEKITDRKRTLPLTVPEEEEAREQLSELKD
jgi:DNA repair exonuclease SbcCD ATPase subunit